MEVDNVKRVPVIVSVLRETFKRCKNVPLAARSSIAESGGRLIPPGPGPCQLL